MEDVQQHDEQTNQSQIIDQWKKQIRDSALSSKSKLLALMIASRIENDSLSCIVDYEQLKKDCGISSNTVYLAVKQLVNEGFITKHRRMGDTNTYTIVPVEEPAEI